MLQRVLRKRVVTLSYELDDYAIHDIIYYVLIRFPPVSTCVFIEQCFEISISVRNAHYCSIHFKTGTHTTLYPF